MNGAVDGVLRAQAEAPLQEFRKLIGCHLARRADEFTVLCAAASSNVPGDPHVVGRIEECHGGAFALHQAGIGIRLACIAYKNTMPPQHEDVACTSHGWHARECRDVSRGVRAIGAEIDEERIKFCGCEAGYAQIQIDLGQ